MSIKRSAHEIKKKTGHLKAVHIISSMVIIEDANLRNEDVSHLEGKQHVFLE